MRGGALAGGPQAFVGGPSGPTLFDQIWYEGIGPEGPPTRTRACPPRHRAFPQASAAASPTLRRRRVAPHRRGTQIGHRPALGWAG
ncbi:DUF6053 domain-containing protein [Lysobacter enzymogenes]|uniref:DUF6053 domain-containing protein n=1 Tax=Lysobacter enzymogenes TaxID=69 RepID=UPI003747B263